VSLTQIFPVIETLNVGFECHNTVNVNASHSSELFSQFQICPTVKTLILENIIGVRTLRNILRVFPNLRKLKLHIGEGESVQVLRQIWGRITQLESLSLTAHIGYTDVVELDSIFTGIPMKGLNEIRHVIPDLEKMTADKRREKILSLVEQYGTQEPSIRNLTNLRHLRLDLRGRFEPNYIPSDISGYLAIYLMKHLKHLDIQQCQFTKTCCETLTRETGLEEWCFQTGGSKHIIPPFEMTHSVFK